MNYDCALDFEILNGRHPAVKSQTSMHGPILRSENLRNLQMNKKRHRCPFQTPSFAIIVVNPT